MFNFFVDNSMKQTDCYTITGADFNHIKNVLRMKEGDEFLVSCEGKSDLCVLREFSGDTVIAEIIKDSKAYHNTLLSPTVLSSDPASPYPRHPL